MAEQNHQNNPDVSGQPHSPEKAGGGKLDAAGKSLFEALRISFVVLKMIMIVLVVVFLASGLETVGPDEQALVLRFGRIRGVGEKRLLGPGLHWVFPYPVEKIVKIPVAKKVNLSINSFWYFQKKSELLSPDPKDKTRPGPTLSPVKDGYCITRSGEQDRNIAGFTGSDYNIVHCKLQLTYQIDDAERFFKNVYVEDVKPGQGYFDVVKKSITPFLESLVEDAVVSAMVHYTIDEAISSQARIPNHVKKLLQAKLSRIDSGIKVVSVQLTDITWPRQVDAAFRVSIKASQESQKAISEARTYAGNTLNEAAGPIAADFLTSLEDKTTSEQEKELLWSQLSGQAQAKISRARAYRTEVVETARANAEYLQKILPEYRKRPRLVVQEIYQDAIECVLSNADEKFIIQPTEGARGTEFWIYLNRDPMLKPKFEK